MSLFVDTSIWYAAASTGDRHNPRAKELLAGERRVLTDHVLAETWRLIAHRISWRAAERWWGGIRSGVAELETVVEADLERAWGIGERFPDQSFSVTDRTSMAVMERLGITRVATLDDDFAVYRYGPARDRAFTIVR